VNSVLRVVLDTNVYISAFAFPNSKTYLVWRRAEERAFHLILSPDIVRETAGILRRRFAFPDALLLQTLKQMVRVAELVTPKERLAVVAADPDDDRILECAVAGNTDLIVSGDQDLLRLGTFQNIPIVSPVDCLRILGVQIG
jgi:putative PIN family toxin of toxin-antitoxin system